MAIHTVPLAAAILLLAAALPATFGSPLDLDTAAAAAASRRILQAAASAPSPSTADAPAASPGAPSPPKDGAADIQIKGGVAFSDMSRSFDVLRYFVNGMCNFPAGAQTIFLPTNQAWVDARDAYAAKSKNSGGLYEALDVVATDKISTSKFIGDKMNGNTLKDYTDRKDKCNTKIISSPFSEAGRTALLNLMSFHATTSRVSKSDLSAQCSATSTSFNTAFNNKMNFKCNDAKEGFISGSDPLARNATSGTAWAVAKIDQQDMDYFYINGIIFPSDIYSLPGTIATVSRLLMALLVLGAALLCAL